MLQTEYDFTLPLATPIGGNLHAGVMAGHRGGRDSAVEGSSRARERSLPYDHFAVASDREARFGSANQSQGDRGNLLRRLGVSAGILQPYQPVRSSRCGSGLSQVRSRILSGAGRRGGILGYPLQELYEEVAYIAYHFHWPAETVLGLEHADRRKWVGEISAINQRVNSE